jgi:hypothetical protein
VNASSASAFENKYSYTDRQPYSSSYYRISQTDNDGAISYFRTIQVNTAQSFSVNHFVRGNAIVVKASGAVPGAGSITVFSIDGRKLSMQQIILTNEESTYSMEKPLQKGVYLIAVERGGERIHSGKVIVD